MLVSFFSRQTLTIRDTPQVAVRPRSRRDRPAFGGSGASRIAFLAVLTHDLAFVGPLA